MINHLPGEPFPGGLGRHRWLSFPPAGGRPALDETGGKACGGAMLVRPSARGRRSLVLESPVASWTRGASKTRTGAKGGNARSTLVRFRFVGGPHPGGIAAEETAWR